MRFIKYIILTAVSLLILNTSNYAQNGSVTRIKCGYFEAGQHPIHSILREEFQRQLKALSPEGMEFVFVPYGYGEGGWRKDSCMVMARKFTAAKDIDLMITVGPWVVEDLLEAGYKGNILAMRQLDPKALGFLGPNGYPKLENLTVHVKPNKIESDLTVLVNLIPVKKVGALFFTTNEAERNAILNVMREAGKKLDFEVVSSEGYDNFGTFAYFKAWNELDKDIDAVYIGPLWGMDHDKIDALLKQIKNSGIPVFTYEGRYPVEQGAFATNSAYSVVSEARYNAIKAIKIADGATPNILPVDFSGGSSVLINEATMNKCGLNINLNIFSEVELLPAPLSDEASQLTLNDAIARAMNANPDYLATYDLIEQAIQNTKTALAEYLPHVDINAYAGYVDDNTVYNTNEPIDNSQLGASLSLHQTIFSLETLKAIKIAGKNKQLESLNQRQARHDLELAVTLAYINYLRANEMLFLQERYLQISERNIEISGTRYFLEDEERYSDYVRWQSERLQIKQKAMRANSEADIARVMLNALLNFPADYQLSLDTTLLANDAVFTDLSYISQLLTSNENVSNFKGYLVSLSKDQNPGYNSYNLQREIQNLTLSKTGSRLFPSLDLKASYNMHDRLKDTPGIFEEKNNSWSVFGMLNFPIFDGTSRSHEKSRTKARISELEFKQDAYRLEQMGEIYQRTSRVINLAQTLPGLMHSQSLAFQLLSLASLDYESDKIGIIEVLDVISHAYQSEISSINTRYQFATESARLVNELGFSSAESYGTYRDILRSKIMEFMKR